LGEEITSAKIVFGEELLLARIVEEEVSGDELFREELTVYRFWHVWSQLLQVYRHIINKKNLWAIVVKEIEVEIELIIPYVLDSSCQEKSFPTVLPKSNSGRPGRIAQRRIIWRRIQESEVDWDQKVLVTV
jgi:hypothetical protein